jgi:serine/threonine protein kinase
VKRSDGAVDPTLTPSEVKTHSAATSATVAAAGRATEPEGGARPSKLTLAGYDVGEMIGKGGMGEVLLAHDSKIGRNVAIKRMAKIQARLDHPAIVPVHALGEDADGRPYFTMKRLTGRTLEEVLDEASQQKLLRAFVDVCLAIELAHTRGVVHRDLERRPARSRIDKSDEGIAWRCRRRPCTMGADDAERR